MNRKISYLSLYSYQCNKREFLYSTHVISCLGLENQKKKE